MPIDSLVAPPALGFQQVGQGVRLGHGPPRLSRRWRGAPWFALGGRLPALPGSISPHVLGSVTLRHGYGPWLRMVTRRAMVTVVTRPYRPTAAQIASVVRGALTHSILHLCHLSLSGDGGWWGYCDGAEVQSRPESQAGQCAGMAAGAGHRLGAGWAGNFPSMARLHPGLVPPCLARSAQALGYIAHGLPQVALVSRPIFGGSPS